jgi:Flp pilus assembly protein TadD
MLHNMAVALATVGRPEPAAQAARDLIAAAPGDPRGYIDLGVVLARMGRRDEARAVFERGLAQCPGDAALRHNLERLMAPPPPQAPALP